jgi:hypothetical protein
VDAVALANIEHALGMRLSLWMKGIGLSAHFGEAYYASKQDSHHAYSRGVSWPKQSPCGALMIAQPRQNVDQLSRLGSFDMSIVRSVRRNGECRCALLAQRLRPNEGGA